MEHTNNGWDQWKNHVLSELREQKDDLRSFRMEFDKFRLQMLTSAAEKKGSNRAWAIIAGAGSSALLFLAEHVIVPQFFKK